MYSMATMGADPAQQAKIMDRMQQLESQVKALACTGAANLPTTVNGPGAHVLGGAVVGRRDHDQPMAYAGDEHDAQATQRKVLELKALNEALTRRVEFLEEGLQASNSRLNQVIAHLEAVSAANAANAHAQQLQLASSPAIPHAAHLQQQHPAGSPPMQHAAHLQQQHAAGSPQMQHAAHLQQQLQAGSPQMQHAAHLQQQHAAGSPQMQHAAHLQQQLQAGSPPMQHAAHLQQQLQAGSPRMQPHMQPQQHPMHMGVPPMGSPHMQLSQPPQHVHMMHPPSVPEHGAFPVPDASLNQPLYVQMRMQAQPPQQHGQQPMSSQPDSLMQASMGMPSHSAALVTKTLPPPQMQHSMQQHSQSAMPMQQQQDQEMRGSGEAMETPPVSEPNAADVPNSGGPTQLVAAAQLRADERADRAPRHSLDTAAAPRNVDGGAISSYINVSPGFRGRFAKRDVQAVSSVQAMG